MTEQGDATDDSGLVTQVENWVNNALDEIALATDWNSFRTRTSFNLTIGDATYSLPVGGREIIQIRYTETGEPIHHWTIQEAARRSALLTESGKPRFWLEDGNTVSGVNVLYNYRLAPVPDTAYNIEVEYFYNPSDIASASVLPVQDNLVVLVKDRVRAFYLERDQKYNAADRAQRRFEGNLVKLIAKEKRKVAASTQLKFSDIQRTRRPEAIFDPAHYRNF